MKLPNMKPTDVTMNHNPYSAEVRPMMPITTCGPPPRKAKKVAVPIAQTST